MGIKGLGNQANTFGNKFVKALGGDSTGKDALLPPPLPRSGMEATGGVISDYTVGNKIYRAHVFTSTGEFTITDLGDFDPEIEYVIVAGGGAGGSDPGDAGSAGGGGAGGYRSSVVGESTGGGASLESKYPVAWAVPQGAMQIRVGAGGAHYLPLVEMEIKVGFLVLLAPLVLQVAVVVDGLTVLPQIEMDDLVVRVVEQDNLHQILVHLFQDKDIQEVIIVLVEA